MTKKSVIQHLIECDVAGKLSGARSSNRLNYQQSWSLLKLLQVHASKNDYRAVFDFAEDFILYGDSTESPEKGEFYQVKTDKDKKSYSISNLLSNRTIRKKTDNLDVIKKSFLQKLFDNRTLFSDIDVDLIFVSNIPYQLNLKNKDKKSKELKEVMLSDLDQVDIEKIEKKLGDSYSLNDYLDTVLQVSDLSLDQEDRDKLLKAELINLIEVCFPSKAYKAGPILKALSSEIAIRSNYEMNPDLASDFFTKKTISKEKFEEFLTKGIAATNPQDKWQEIQPLLIADKLDSGEILELKTAFYNLQKMYIEDSGTANEAVEKIRIVLKEVDRTGKKLIEIVEECLVEYNKNQNELSSALSDKLIKVMVLDEAV